MCNRFSRIYHPRSDLNKIREPGIVIRSMSMLVVSMCLNINVRSQPSQQTLKPVDFITKGTHVYLKAEMSPASPDDLKRRFMQWCTAEDEYKNRQFIAKGVAGKGLIAAAFRTSYDRVLLEAPFPETLYSVEVIVPPGREDTLNTLLQTTVQAGLGVIAGWEEIKTEVRVLKRNPLYKPEPGLQLNLKPSTSEKAGFSWDSSSISGVGVTIKQVSELLSGQVGVPVIEETGLEGKFDIDIRWKEDEPGSLEKALLDVGLNLGAEQRAMKMLIVKPGKSPAK